MMAIETPARIAILGAGPIGLEAALYARYLGYDVDLYERGTIAENVLRWGHVRMFSPFGRNRSPLGLAALKAQDPAWQAPADDAILTGRQYAERYLIPLAHCDLLVDGLHQHTTVEAIGRVGLLKGQFAGDLARGDGEFRLLVSNTDQGEHGRQRFAMADVVIDATGTYGHHSWLGPDGLPAIGEVAAEPHIEYGLPDVLGSAREHYASRNILLVGDGDSAASSLVALAELAAQAADTWITWVTRATCDERAPEPVVPHGEWCLAERARLAQQANRLAVDDANHVTFYSGTSVDAIYWHGDLGRFVVRLAGKHAGEMEFDRIVANVGYRPDFRLARELQLNTCWATEAPRPPGESPIGQGDTAADAAHHQGPQALVQPEPDFYVLGAKSYGRDARFCIETGLAQIRELFAIIGDRATLDLYATMAGLY